jgi:hypothetical protein
MNFMTNSSFDSHPSVVMLTISGAADFVTTAEADSDVAFAISDFVSCKTWHAIPMA